MSKNEIALTVMKESEWRGTIQSLLEEAALSGEVNLAALAREVGWKPPALHNFRHKGYGAKEKVEALESKLRQRGFGPTTDAATAPPQATQSASHVSVNEALASQFQAVADTLRSDLPQEEKGRVYLDFMTRQIKAMKLYSAEMEKIQDD